jgi:drug/metabolite transporter (DMT)-like permease
MTRLLLILLIGLTFESTGIVFLKKGMNQLGDVGPLSPAGIVRVIKAGATNRFILAGVFFQALFFACLLVLMARSDISFLWPLTALSFVFATIAAVLFLGEKVDGYRWLGVVLIMIGAGFISYSEHQRPKAPPPPAAAAR